MYQAKGIPERAIPVLMNSWRTSTKKQYDSHLKKWLDFITRKSINVSDPLSVTVVLEFLTELFDKGYSYSTINSARSFLSCLLPPINNVTIGSDPLIRRFMRGVFIDRPNLPRYTETWDVSTVLSFMREMGDNDFLSVFDLTLKLVMLLALVTGQRAQTLSLLNLDDMHVYEDRIVFCINNLIKQSRPSYHLKPITLLAFANKMLCVVSCLKTYIAKTEQFRSSENRPLLLTTQKPYRGASKDSISRWIRTLLAKSGIDTSKFSGHSTRAAASAAARSAGISVDNILSHVGWSNEGTFAKFYDKDVFVSDLTFQNAILSSASCVNN